MTSIAREPDAERDVARRAYELWEAEGRPHGRDREHWDRAAQDAAATATPGEAAEPAPPVAAKPAKRKPAAAKVAKVVDADAPVAKPARRRKPEAGS